MSNVLHISQFNGVSQSGLFHHVGPPAFSASEYGFFASGLQVREDKTLNSIS